MTDTITITIPVDRINSLNDALHSASYALADCALDTYNADRRQDLIDTRHALDDARNLVFNAIYDAIFADDRDPFTYEQTRTA